MRLARLIAGAALCGMAAIAAAQNVPPAEPEQKQSSLSDLEATVNELRDDAPAQEEAPVQPAPARAQPPAETPPPAAQTAPPPARPRTAAPSRPAPPLTAAQQAALTQVTERGRTLIAIAGAGQIATQDLLSRIPNPNGEGIDGWIAEPEGNAVTVTFYHEQEGGPTTVYRANVLGNRVVSRDQFLGSFRPPLSRAQARLAAARGATERLDSRPCTSQPFNVFVLPPPRGGAPIEVYRMSAPAERNRFPLGGHFKAVINNDGAIASQRTFVDGCPMLDIGAAPVAGQPVQPLAVAGGADALPTEIHMLISRMTGRPLLVTTGDPARQWLVAGERVAEVRDGQIVEPAATATNPNSAPRPQGR